MNYYAIALDGPAGAGKSTMAKALAAELGCVYLDTGAIYRTVAYHMALMGISPRDADGVARMIDDVNIRIEFDADRKQHMILNGQDVTDELRTPEMSQGASLVSAHAVVREVLLDLQRDIAKNHNVVMDGRDIGTVVLPDAQVKIFLTADVRVRAERRYKELLEKGQKTDYETVLSDMERRDEQDSTRAIAPLRCAVDAVRVDTSAVGIEESVAMLRAVVREKLGI
ncbi:MAG: (d)CMP kinase [Oscillospiraceae bacterium]|nr:(d)CMP kinase [Oscillospiraceae bacterium]